ncbi:hypothetical protein [Lactobacillus johnsonii]|uniref:hypothetical protein n=1 Tax=Lactobacillus johnsonii TaxID=33959 RepID=UPI00107E7B97|nr:hypothetical protein [Lactobacillus johnsonii]TGA94107.1 hypothetical protein E5F86_04925 [Lactobacillus johnsonii]
MAKIEYKDIKEYKKEKRGEWVDKNWQFIVEGWSIIFLLFLLSCTAYSFNLNKNIFDIHFFINNVSLIGKAFIGILALIFLFLMCLANKKAELFYFDALIAISLIWVLTINRREGRLGLNLAYIFNIFVGIFYVYLRCKKKITNKMFKNSARNIKTTLSIIIPAIATIIAELLDK